MDRLIVGRRVLVHGRPGVASGRALGVAALHPAAVLVRDGRIEAVEPPDGARTRHPHAVVEDVGDALLTPAFVDGHTHVALHALRGITGHRNTGGNVVEDLFYAFESGLSADEVRAFARMGAWEALLHGTGAVFDHYFHATAIAEALVEVGLTGVVAPTIQDLGGPFAHAADDALATVATLDTPAWAARGIAAALGPHAMDTVSAALWARIADVAAQRQLPVHVHVAQSLEEVARVAARTGRTPVSELLATGVLDAAPRTLLVHLVYAATADVAALPAARALLGFCPHSAFVFGHPARPDRWEAAGVPWLVGSDCAASNDAMDVRGELRVVHGLAAWATSGAADYDGFLGGDPQAAERAWRHRTALRAAAPGLLTPDGLLAHVTSVPSQLHPRFTAGVIAPGAAANLALWDVEHPVFWPAVDPLRALALGNPTPALLQVMTWGAWRGERGRFAESLRESPLYAAHRAEATARLHERLDRLSLAR